MFFSKSAIISNFICKSFSTDSNVLCKLYISMLIWFFSWLSEANCELYLDNCWLSRDQALDKEATLSLSSSLSAVMLLNDSFLLLILSKYWDNITFSCSFSVSNASICRFERSFVLRASSTSFLSIVNSSDRIWLRSVRAIHSSFTCCSVFSNLSSLLFHSSSFVLDDGIVLVSSS